MHVSQEYLAKQCYDNPHIRRTGFLTLRDVETLTGIPYETLRKHASDGTLKKIHPTGVPRFDLTEVYAYLIKRKFVRNPVDVPGAMGFDDEDD